MIVENYFLYEKHVVLDNNKEIKITITLKLNLIFKFFNSKYLLYY